MTRSAAFVCGLLLTAPLGFAQNEPGHPVPDTTVAVDTLTLTTMSADTNRHHDGTPSVEETFPRRTKLPIVEEHIFDVSTQPVSIGEKEIRVVALGRRWESEFVGTPAAMKGKVTAGYGSYVTPLLLGWVGSASPQGEFIARGFFRSSEGPDENRDVRSGAGAAAATWYLSERAGVVAGGRVSASLAVHGDRYRLYGSTSPSQARSRVRVESELNLNSAETGRREVQIVFNGMRSDDTRRAEEFSLGARIAAAESVGHTSVRGEVNLWKDFRTQLAGGNPFFSALSVYAESRVAGSITVTGGTLVHYLENPTDPLRWRVLPRAGIVWTPTNALSLFARYEPSVQRRTVSSFLQENPFVRSSLAVRSTDGVVNVTGGLAVNVADVGKASAAFKYRRVHGYPMFSYTSERMWEVTYTQTTRMTSIESEIYVEPGASLVGVKVVLQQSRAEANRPEAVPYLPEVLVKATAQHAFAMGLRVASDVRYTGRRYADLQNARSLPAFVVWDVRAEYGERIRVGAEVTNVLDRRESAWEGYAGEPRRIMLSLGYTW